MVFTVIDPVKSSQRLRPSSGRGSGCDGVQDDEETSSNTTINRADLLDSRHQVSSTSSHNTNIEPAQQRQKGCLAK